MIVPVLKMGNPSLLQPSVLVGEDEFNSPELLQLITDLRDTQQHLGGVGIAAPQIGVNKQVVIIEYSATKNKRYSDIGECPCQVIINPQLTLLEGATTTFKEGCLSVPGLRGDVTRPQGVKYQYYNEKGELITGEDHGFFARVLQHECDHLAGILYPMRMQDLSTLAFIDAVPSEE